MDTCPLALSLPLPLALAIELSRTKNFGPSFAIASSLARSLARAHAQLATLAARSIVRLDVSILTDGRRAGRQWICATHILDDIVEHQAHILALIAAQQSFKTWHTGQMIVVLEHAHTGRRPGDDGAAPVNVRLAVTHKTNATLAGILIDVQLDADQIAGLHSECNANCRQTSSIYLAIYMYIDMYMFVYLLDLPTDDS